MSRYSVIDTSTGNVIETGFSDAQAQRAKWTLTAHERKNGRDTVYAVSPAPNSDGSDFEIFDLPTWALDALRKAKKDGVL